MPLISGAAQLAAMTMIINFLPQLLRDGRGCPTRDSPDQVYFLGSTDARGGDCHLEESSQLSYAASIYRNIVLGAGLEPACLSAYAPQTYVSAIPPPEQSAIREVGVRSEWYLWRAPSQAVCLLLVSCCRSGVGVPFAL